MRFAVRLLLILGVSLTAHAAEEIRPDFAMESDPVLIIPEPVFGFSKKSKPLWLSALARPEADLQRLSAETIAQAHFFGVPELIDAAPLLKKIVTAESTHPVARFAAARALIALDATDTAADLFEVSQRHGADLRQLIEPALAKWKFEPIRSVWRQRLSAKDTRHRELLLAIHGLGESADGSAVPALLSIAHDSRRSSACRLAAARSAGRLREADLETDAERLTQPASATIVERLCAVSLLDRHASEAAQSALLRLARDREPSVAVAALTRLNAIDHDLVVPRAEQAMQNDDAPVRQQGVDAFVARPTPERIAVLAKLLDDPHPKLRGRVRDALFVLAKRPELDSAVRQSATKMLAGDRWRGQEQAALLLAALDHKPAAPRFVELVESTRVEVMIAAAWGLRKLAVRETLPAIFSKATRQTEIRLKQGSLPELDVQVAHLFEALGLMQHAPADPLLRKYFPKDPKLGELSRSAAIWGLGHLYAGTTEEPLAVLMVERLTESPAAIPFEFPRVRWASAVSLGRMRAKSQVPRMRAFLGPVVGPETTSLAIRWAINEITGELLPNAEPMVVTKAGWFLEPLDEDK
ncbi:MAG: phycocyanin alpha phycocyanobilin lyase [Planctomycetota bacterium]|nr:MAG: phycocyanin alpha phycocyanobilin lyase [Planctomycetota bacterium]